MSIARLLEVNGETHVSSMSSVQLTIEVCAEHGQCGATAKRNVPHTCIAYQLLRGYNETVDIGDWFASFCLALGAKASETPNAEAKGKRKGRTAQKKKKKMRTVERTCDEAAPPTAQVIKGVLDGDSNEVRHGF